MHGYCLLNMFGHFLCVPMRGYNRGVRDFKAFLWACTKKTALYFSHIHKRTEVSDLCETLKAITLGWALSFVLCTLLKLWERAASLVKHTHIQMHLCNCHCLNMEKWHAKQAGTFYIYILLCFYFFILQTHALTLERYTDSTHTKNMHSQIHQYISSFLFAHGEHAQPFMLMQTVMTWWWLNMWNLRHVASNIPWFLIQLSPPWASVPIAGTAAAPI